MFVLEFDDDDEEVDDDDKNYQDVIFYKYS